MYLIAECLCYFQLKVSVPTYSTMITLISIFEPPFDESVTALKSIKPDQNLLEDADQLCVALAAN